MRNQANEKMSQLRETINNVTYDKVRLQSSVKACCIKARNKYSQCVIQQDFAMGIKELDEEAAMLENEENFTPDEHIRHYDKIARDLSVFCVSSRAYQKMKGRLQKDEINDDGFRKFEKTEIPQLHLHARKITEEGRMTTCRQFLNDLNQFLNSMRLWAIDFSNEQLSDMERQKEKDYLRLQLLQLARNLDQAMKECICSIQNAISEKIHAQLESSISHASNAAIQTAMGWGASRDSGGLLWTTYRATCRRDSVFASQYGPQDFNAELTEPLTKHISSVWERVFQCLLPRALKTFAESSRLHLRNFYYDATAKCQQRHKSHTGIDFLKQQVRTQQRKLKDLPEMLWTNIKMLQQIANRGFHVTIKGDMRRAYANCLMERGAGSYARMKSHMIDYVESNRLSMFRHSTDIAKEQLQSICQRVENDISDQLQSIHNVIAQDYGT
ncbi:tat pathway signal sequence [Colletotrichum truncatum]|uniref:Tat pathway signal sequence n=1 Tax=Colletotrichum truncatum TaxID=5467 RepID=A0ACC3ZLD8_COLTU